MTIDAEKAFIHSIFDKAVERQVANGKAVDTCAFRIPAPDPTGVDISFKVSPVCVIEEVATQEEVSNMKPYQIYPIGKNPVLQITDHSRFKAENLLYDGVEIPYDLWDIVFTKDTILVPVNKAPTPELSNSFWILHKKDGYAELVGVLPFGDASIYFDTLPICPFTITPELAHADQLKELKEGIKAVLTMTRVKPTASIKILSPYSLCYVPIMRDVLAPGSKAVELLSNIVDVNTGVGYSLSGIVKIDPITCKKINKEGAAGFNSFTKVLKKKEKEMKGLPSPLKTKLGVKLPTPVQPKVEAPEVDEPSPEEIDEIYEETTAEAVEVVQEPAPEEVAAEPVAVTEEAVEEVVSEVTEEAVEEEPKAETVQDKKPPQRKKPSSATVLTQVIEYLSADLPALTLGNMAEALEEIRQLRDVIIACDRRMANRYTQLHKASEDSIKKMEAIKEAMK